MRCVMSALDEAVTAVFASAAGSAYLGEAVTVAEHMLRTAWRARLADAPAPLIAAGLLHDVGHVDGGLDAATAFAAGVDAGHETVGARWLESMFPPAVTEPVRLHVQAKRYLCAIDAGYERALSPASRRTLELQGGPLGPDEAAAFRAGPHALAAVELRRWDDEGKDPCFAVPPLPSYLPLLGRVAR